MALQKRIPSNYVTFTDFRNNLKKYFDNIENGISYIITRRGKPIAQVIPLEEIETGWKRENQKITLKKSKTSLEYTVQER